MNKTVTATLIAAMGASACAPVMVEGENAGVVEKPYAFEASGSLIPTLAFGILLALGAGSGDVCDTSSC